MNCEQAQQWMHETLDGTASSERFQPHLSACPQCRREWEMLRSADAALRVPRPVAAPEDLLQEFRARLVTAEAGATGGVKPRPTTTLGPLRELRAWWRRHFWLAAGPVAVAGLAGAVLWLNGGLSRPAGPMVARNVEVAPEQGPDTALFGQSSTADTERAMQRSPREAASDSLRTPQNALPGAPLSTVKRSGPAETLGAAPKNDVPRQGQELRKPAPSLGTDTSTDKRPVVPLPSEMGKSRAEQALDARVNRGSAQEVAGPDVAELKAAPAPATPVGDAAVPAPPPAPQAAGTAGTPSVKVSPVIVRALQRPVSVSEREVTLQMVAQHLSTEADLPVRVAAEISEQRVSVTSRNQPLWQVLQEVALSARLQVHPVAEGLELRPVLVARTLKSATPSVRPADPAASKRSARQVRERIAEEGAAAPEAAPLLAPQQAESDRPAAPEPPRGPEQRRKTSGATAPAPHPQVWPSAIWGDLPQRAFRKLPPTPEGTQGEAGTP